jgi:hypothetical protein
MGFTPQPIICVIIDRDIFNKLNLDQVTPSFAMVNFVHVISFDKTQDFSAVAPMRKVSYGRTDIIDQGDYPPSGETNLNKLDIEHLRKIDKGRRKRDQGIV